MTRAEAAAVPASRTITFEVESSEDIYKLIAGEKSQHAKVLEAISEGKAEVVDAVLYLGRFNRDGMLLRESKAGAKPYRLLRTRSADEYRDAMARRDSEWRTLRESGVKEDYDFTSSSDLGSTFAADPNQFTEYTPYFNGPFSKQQYFDYFAGHSRAFEQSTHGIGKRIIDILCQYSIGRGVRVRCKDEAKDKKWKDFQRRNRIYFKLRKYWIREYLTYGEDYIDKLRWTSIDPSTIYDIICEGFDEHIDKPLYYQQMFQTATQTYAGIAVPGVPGSKDSKIGKYIVRQIPAEQVIHIKTNVVSVEKRGRSVLYAVLGWIKRLTDVLNAQALGEQLRASIIYDDTVDGQQEDVDAHAAKYNYIPVAPTLFVHNKTVERKPLAPMANISATGSNIVQELLAYIGAITGIPKEHLNVIVSSGGSRATAIVGSEPFTKVIEDLQEDATDFLRQVVECFCQQNGEKYDEDEWFISFPSPVKDATKDKLANIALCEAQGWFSPERAANLAAEEMDQDEYDYTEEQAKRSKNNGDKLAAGLGVKPAPQAPASRFGKPTPAADEENPDPMVGSGKLDTIRKHKKL